MVSQVSVVADGVAGIRQIVATLNQLKSYYGRLEVIRMVALRIIAGAGNHDQAAQVTRLASFVRGAIVYVADPLNAEFIQTPDVLLLLIARNGFAQGDCDDHCILFATLCEAIGIPAEVVGVTSQNGTQPDHVIVIAQLDAGPLEFDLCAKGTDQPYYPEKLFA